MTQRRYAEVAVNLPLDGSYTYAIPKHLDLQIGHAVLVPFGSRKLSGYVVALADHTELTRVRSIDRLLDPEPVFEPNQLDFFKWIANYYVAGIGEVIATALPRDYKGKSVRVYLPTEAGVDAIATGLARSENQALVLCEVISSPGRTARGMTRRFHDELDGPKVQRVLAALVKKDWLRIEERFTANPKAKLKVVVLTGSDVAIRAVTGARMIAALNALQDAGGELLLSDLARMEGATIRSAVKRLEKRDLVVIEEREDLRTSVFNTLPARQEPFPLNDQQQAAYDAIISGERQTHLLYGVTGAGKTEVYLQAAQHFAQLGKQTLVLVPEIALTPLLIGRVQARFGDRVAALHSGLKNSERVREWRRIRAGEADVAVGARSALFAPFPDLGLIIVDEEHDDSYKQGDGVRYNARDLAVLRGIMDDVPVVLGSATPSVETYSNAQHRKYNLLRISSRATPKPVPNMQLVDMRGRPPTEVISSEVANALSSTFSRGNSAIVLYNRRGYAPVVECSGCGSAYICPSCEVSMVLHHRSQKISCHYCGFYRNYSPECPQCSIPLNIVGYGTERVEEELQLLLPDIAISRMDADTTATRGAHHRILDDFRTGKTQLLVGTQLVAKGHDFPSVTMAAVIGVDHVLTLPDFRSAERTFALVTQLAGRAGRGTEPGQVLVQTRHPDHFVFKILSNQDGQDPGPQFYQQELRQRNILRYPPSSRLVLLGLEGEQRDRVRKLSVELARSLRSTGGIADGVDVLGPVSAPLSKLVGRHRVQIILRGTNVTVFRSWVEQIRPLLRDSASGGVRLYVDVDPRSLL